MSVGKTQWKCALSKRQVANILIIVRAALLATISATSSRAMVCRLAIINLISGGLIVQLLFTVRQVKAGPKNVQSVNTLLTTAQIFSLAVSLRTATTFFVNITVPVIEKIMPDSTKSVVYALIEGARDASFSTIPNSVRHKILKVVTKSTAKTFYILVAYGALRLVTAQVLKQEKLVL